MDKERKVKYRDPESLRKLFMGLKGMKFRLDCGHYITFGYYLGNDIIIRNGKAPKITCLECGR